MPKRAPPTPINHSKHHSIDIDVIYCRLYVAITCPWWSYAHKTSPLWLIVINNSILSHMLLGIAHHRNVTIFDTFHICETGCLLNSKLQTPKHQNLNKKRPSLALLWAWLIIDLGRWTMLTLAYEYLGTSTVNSRTICF